MTTTDRELTAARELGEAILRFVLTVASGSQARLLRARLSDGVGQSALSVADGGSAHSIKVLFTVAETAQMLSVGRTLVYSLMETGKLPYVKIGGTRRVRLADVLSLIEAHTVARH